MGSWNQTCGITNLPILSQDDVYVFFMVSSRDRGKASISHYPTDFFTLLPVFLEGKYNDYGAIEQDSCMSETWKVIEQEFKVSSVDELFDKLHDETLTVEDREYMFHENGGVSTKRVDRIVIPFFVRKEVLDGLLNEFFMSTWQQIKHPFADFQNTMVQSARRVQEKIIKKVIDKELSFYKGPVEKDCHELALYFNDYCSKKMLWPVERMVIEDYPTQIEPMIKQACTVIWIVWWASAARVSLAPPSGAGSQESECEAQLLRASLTQVGAKEIERKYNDYD